MVGLLHPLAAVIGKRARGTGCGKLVCGAAVQRAGHLQKEFQEMQVRF
jgi:hypothetical protein